MKNKITKVLLLVLCLIVMVFTVSAKNYTFHNYNVTIEENLIVLGTVGDDTHRYTWAELNSTYIDDDSAYIQNRTDVNLSQAYVDNLTALGTGHFGGDLDTDSDLTVDGNVDVTENISGGGTLLIDDYAAIGADLNSDVGLRVTRSGVTSAGVVKGGQFFVYNKGSGSESYGLSLDNYGGMSRAGSATAYGARFQSTLYNNNFINPPSGTASQVMGGDFRVADYPGRVYNRTGTGYYKMIAMLSYILNARGDWTTNNPPIITYGLYIYGTPTGYGSAHTHYAIYGISGDWVLRADDDKIRLGATLGDFDMYSDGDNARIDTTGDLVISSDLVGNDTHRYTWAELNFTYTDDDSAYVPYTGATSSVVLGNKNLTTNGTIKSNRFALYEPIEDNTNYIIPYSQALFDDKTLTLWYTGNYRLSIFGNTSVDQDVHTGATPTWPSINIDSLEMGDDTPTEGNWILDVAPTTLDPRVGDDGADGEGVNLLASDGQDSIYAGTAGDGGRVNIRIGAKGTGTMGASDGIDGILNITGLPLEAPTATSMYVCWDTDGHIFLNETGCR